MKNAKRIAAVIGIAALLLLYLATLIAAILAKPYANGMFFACAISTIVIPILIYGYIMIYKLVHKDDKDSVTLHELRKKNKEYEKQEKTKRK